MLGVHLLLRAAQRSVAQLHLDVDPSGPRRLRHRRRAAVVSVRPQSAVVVSCWRQL